jgi:hypothetical protein
LADVQAFSTIESNFPKFFGQYRPDCIRLAVHTLSRLVPFHWQYSVKQDGAEQMPNDYDADLVFGTLALEILTFLAPSSRAKSVKSLWVKTEGDKEVATDLLAEMVRSTAGVMPVTYAYVSADRLGLRWNLRLRFSLKTGISTHRLSSLRMMRRQLTCLMIHDLPVWT